MEAAALAFASASQLGTAGNCSSSSSSSAGSRSLRFMQIKPNRIALKFKPSRSSIRASATGEDDSGNLHRVQSPDEVLKEKHRIFPGVGAFATAMDVLNKKGLEDWAAMENAFQEFDGLVRSCTWSRNRCGVNGKCLWLHECIWELYPHLRIS
nr:imidazole glycerol phosphate synthase hisHF, chloroplastic [Ipomoea batatas]